MVPDLQEAFRHAVLDPASGTPGGLLAHHREGHDRRFAVYRNNVTQGLAGALESRFPAAISLVGAEFFHALAVLFVRRHPPRTPLLLAYGDAMPDFVAAFEPAREVPYLADVMRVEIARSQAYHAADDKPADLSDLRAIDPAALGETRVAFHAAVRLLRSPFPAATIWQMNAGGDARALPDRVGEDVLVTRPLLDVQVQVLPPGGHAFLAALRDGEPLGAAAGAAFAEAPGFDLAAAVAGLVAAGIATRFHPPAED